MYTIYNIHYSITIYIYMCRNDQNKKNCLNLESWAAISMEAGYVSKFQGIGTR